MNNDKNVVNMTLFRRCENANRILAENSARMDMVNIYNNLKKNPTSPLYRQYLLDAGLEPDKVIQNGLTKDNVDKFSMYYTRASQGGFGPEYKPYWGSLDGFKPLFLLRSFQVQYSDFLLESIWSHGIAHGNFAPLIKAGIVTPAVGYPIMQIQRLMSGKADKDDRSAINTYILSIAYATGFGLFSDFLQNTLQNKTQNLSIGASSLAMPASRLISEGLQGPAQMANDFPKGLETTARFLGRRVATPMITNFVGSRLGPTAGSIAALTTKYASNVLGKKPE
jgi:hypothetical protein